MIIRELIAPYSLSSFDVKELLKKHGLELSSSPTTAFREDLELYLKNYPLQYIIGEWEFYGYDFFVGEGVLIPRQDTETIIDKILELYNKNDSLNIADFCAGSGCIGITLARLFNESCVRMYEISDTAIGYISKNIERNAVTDRAFVEKADVLNISLEGEELDLLVSNPPYIKTEVIKTLDDNVKFEPDLALDGGEDGLIFYISIAKIAKLALKTGGYLVFEIGYDQGAEVSEILKTNDYSEITIVKDLTGNDRCVYGRK